VFQSNRKPTFGIIGSPIGKLGVEEVPLPTAKKRIAPRLDGDPYVGITTDNMGVLMLGRLV
jgi:hypothetical protein